jgi:hypothetical protein
MAQDAIRSDPDLRESNALRAEVVKQADLVLSQISDVYKNAA